jgi:6-pyruvoyltetrahydropterin/6-carboxytetrahydropterin synthase
MAEIPGTYSVSMPPESIALRRTVRVGVCPTDKADAQASGAERRRNGLAGIPPADGWAAHHEIDVECVGAPDPQTGYLVGIQEIDAAVRHHAVGVLRDGAARGDVPPATVPAAIAAAIAHALPAGAPVRSVRWRPGPFVSYTWERRMPDHALLAERFEFSAAHRLHCPQLSDEENRRTFGKCNHPSGHGHNYRVEVEVAVPTGPAAPPMTSAALEAIVMREVIDRFDHRHLNADCAEFAALNPSVENIARVCHGLLDAPVRSGGARLRRVTVWETEKTSATYPAE